MLLEGTRKVVLSIFRKVLLSSTDTTCEELRDRTGIDISWMTTGEKICTLPLSSEMCLAQVKVQIQQHTGLTFEEQHLICNGQEISTLPINENVSLCLVAVTDPRITDMSCFRAEPSSFQSLCSGDFKMVRFLANGINGDVYRYSMTSGSQSSSVAVKKIRGAALRAFDNMEKEERRIHTSPTQRYCSQEDALTEIGVLSDLSKQPDLPLYLLKMHGVYTEPNTAFTWLVTEFADGGELFNVAASGDVGEARVKDYTWQLLQAVEYLHRHKQMRLGDDEVMYTGIGHRDISLENVLLKNGTVRLMDFGMAVRTHSSTGTALRYFREVGKDFYRAPECYVPSSEHVQVKMPLDSKPGDIVMVQCGVRSLCEVRLPQDAAPGEFCRAQVWGYEAIPADIFSVAMCMFILAFQCPLFERATVTDRFFSQLYKDMDHAVERQLQLWNKSHLLSAEAKQLLLIMIQTDPVKRPSAVSCLAHPWFADMADRKVELHPSESK